MASIPQLYTDYSFAQNYPQFSSTLETYNINLPVTGGTIWCGGSSEDKYPLFFDHPGIDIYTPDVTSPVPVMTTLPEQLGVSDLMVPTLLSENTLGLSGVHNNNMHRFNIVGGIQFHQDMSDQFGDECCGFLQDIKPAYSNPTSIENWGNQGNNQVATVEDTNMNMNMKVGRYSAEERKDRIVRYLKKKNQRNFNKTIKYACRKTLADRRVRVRGRFARNNELCEDDMVMKRNDHSAPKEEELSPNSAQIKQDEEWLQEAISSLMYLPHIPG
ncbi:hypothetical protein ACFE04_022039 [Oxalis oulophora]